MTRQKTLSYREAEFFKQPVRYWPNGKIKFPVGWTRLLRECERLKAENQQLRAKLYDSGRAFELWGDPE